MSGLRSVGVTLVYTVLAGLLTACSSDTGDPASSTGVPASAIAPTEPTSVLYVSPGGDDGNSGTQEAPVRTVARAADMVEPGTRVVVADGTYTGSVRTGASGTAEARIAFVAANPGGARIVGDDTAEAAWQNTGSYVDIVGFDVTGPNTDGLASAGSFVRIVDNRVSGFRRGNCVYVQNDDYSLTDVDVIGNVTFDCGGDELDHGIYVTHRRGLVANNISYRSAGFGIQCWHACNEIVVVNNLVFDNAAGGIVVGGEFDEADNEGGTADDSLVANNIAVGNGREGIREGGESGPDNRFVNNLLWNNERDDISIKTGRETGTLVEDPQFVNYQPNGSGDYRLVPSSPAVDGGTGDGAPPFAIDGAARPRSGGVDVGPYEQ